MILWGSSLPFAAIRGDNVDFCARRHGSFSFWREAEPHPDRVIACDVGQGDAVVLQTSKNATVLIDGGPGDAVLACLGQAMPFWDRTIEMIILTHRTPIT